MDSIFGIIVIIGIAIGIFYVLKKIQRQSPNKLTREDEKILEIGNNVKNTVSNSFDKAKNFVEKKHLNKN